MITKNHELRLNLGALPKVNILGVGVHAITMAQALAQISNWIEQGIRQYVSICTVHTVMECQRSEPVRRAVNSAGLATPDGMPLVWLGQLKSKLAVTRVYGPDLMLALCELSVQRGYRHYFYGGADGVAEQLAQRLQTRFPGLHMAGTYCPPYRPAFHQEDDHIIEQINQTSPDIIWVGLGTPKQDLWMAAHRDRLTAPVLIAVGAAFDFHTGRLPQAPHWMQRNGLEWFFRLLQEPRRLWHRYLVYNPLFILLIIAQALGLKKFSLD
ncbi:MAG: WecB/TagA/CpsF family glycosyltransferase [Anaerolineae bacterium]|nr:WecB/TagA/CpsF family glycosyltransferase [Anaerolineae bacterium]